MDIYEGLMNKSVSGRRKHENVLNQTGSNVKEDINGDIFRLIEMNEAGFGQNTCRFEHFWWVNVNVIKLFLQLYIQI